MSKLLNQIANPIVKWLLRSPFHHLLSKHVLLISVTGRKTHRIYSTPVEYDRNGNSITLISWQQRTWWKNLLEQSPVELVVEGQTVRGIAKAYTDDEHVKDAVHRLFPKVKAEQLTQFAASKVAVNVQLQQSSFRVKERTV